MSPTTGCPQQDVLPKEETRKGKWTPGSRGRTPKGVVYSPDLSESRKKQAARQKALREKRKTEGVCPRCRVPPTPGFVHCQLHRVGANEAYRKYRQKMKKDGLCERCSEPKEEERLKKSMCSLCAKAATERQNKRFKTRVAAGLCGDCRAPLGGRVSRCEKCTVRTREYRRKFDEKRREEKENLK